MERLKWINSGKCDINTGFKAFDKQCDTICTGNAYTNTQRSWYIRPYNECECNGQTFEPGELLEKDIQSLGRIKNLPSLPYYVQKNLFDENRTENICLYVFGTYKDGEFYAFNIIWTDRCGKLISYMVLGSGYSNKYYDKYLDATLKIIPYITNKGDYKIPEDILNKLQAQLAFDPYCMASETLLCDDMVERTFSMRYYWKDTCDGWKKDSSPYITIRRGYHTEDIVRLSDIKEAA